MSGLLMKKCCCVKPCSLCTGATPKSWTVSFTGVDTNFPCVFQGLSPNRNFKGYGDALGTYTIPQSTDPAFPCRYEKQTTGPRVDSHTQTGSGDTSCTPVTVTINDLFLRVNISTVTTQVFAAWDTADSLTSYSWFEGEAGPGGGGGDHDCTATVNLTNQNTTFRNNAGSGSYGINGSAVATPNF